MVVPGYHVVTFEFVTAGSYKFPVQVGMFVLALENVTVTRYPVVVDVPVDTRMVPEKSVQTTLVLHVAVAPVPAAAPTENVGVLFPAKFFAETAPRK